MKKLKYMPIDSDYTELLEKKWQKIIQELCFFFSEEPQLEESNGKIKRLRI